MVSKNWVIEFKGFILKLEKELGSINLAHRGVIWSDYKIVGVKTANQGKATIANKLY